MPSPAQNLSLSGAPVRTFLIADIRGYTRYTHERGDEAAATLAAQFATLARATAQSHGGEVIELRGDEAMAVFDSPRSALRAAVDLQAHCARHTETDQEHPIRIGIGIDAGEALQVEEGFRGSALNVASRLCALAQPGQTLATEGIVHLARRVPGLEMADRGPVELRGVADPLRIFEVAPEGQLPALTTTLQPAVKQNQATTEVRQGAMITGMVGGAFGVAGMLIDLLFGVLSTGKPLLLAGAAGSCLLAFVGAGSIPDHPHRGALLVGVAAIGLGIFVTWASIIGLVLLVIAAGMGYFSGQSRD